MSRIREGHLAKQTNKSSQLPFHFVPALSDVTDLAENKQARDRCDCRSAPVSRPCDNGVSSCTRWLSAPTNPTSGMLPVPSPLLSFPLHLGMRASIHGEAPLLSALSLLQSSSFSAPTQCLIFLTTKMPAFGKVQHAHFCQLLAASMWKPGSQPVPSFCLLCHWFPWHLRLSPYLSPALQGAVPHRHLQTGHSQNLPGPFSA